MFDSTWGSRDIRRNVVEAFVVAPKKVGQAQKFPKKYAFYHV
jgi:hypothetical protein